MAQKNKVGIFMLTIITAVFFGGCAYESQKGKEVPQATTSQETSENSPSSTESTPPAQISEGAKEALSYSESAPAYLFKEPKPFDYTADQLLSMAQECGNEQTESYFNDLISKFNGTSKIVYNFKYTGESQQPDTFVVTLLPNKPGYTSLDQFKKDFDQCYAGGSAYPTMLNKDWLLFVSSCGSGFSDDSRKPIGCQIVSDKVQPTLKLN